MVSNDPYMANPIEQFHHELLKLLQQDFVGEDMLKINNLIAKSKLKVYKLYSVESHKQRVIFTPNDNNS